ncbi:hypothetical protein BDN67DRAFT_989616 [Paxillus ammoniavirescens]|nr:hypothetical protein BDN67DRAFT_989616 [Paxillus ammoniavirescens]
MIAAGIVVVLNFFVTYEKGMRVPVSALNGCGESFVAVDEKCQKVSTHFFADTGLIGLLCRHDHVLRLINMTSPGERQHYALILLLHLFDHLPPTMTVGLLYDISCQLEHSCWKWGLLDNVLSCLKFAISVFHAYGHQWPCQIIYHPQKCVSFRLSDGEGCEQLWSSLKFLILILRVSGYHQHLFILDDQVHHLDDKSLLGFGRWLAKKWELCQRKKEIVKQALEALDVDDSTLWQEWAAQVAHQTKLLPSKLDLFVVVTLLISMHLKWSGNKAAEEIEKILALENLVESYQACVSQLEDDLTSDGEINIVDHNIQLAEAQASLDKATQMLDRRKTALGVSRRANFIKLHKDLERLEQSYRSTTAAHTESSSKKWRNNLFELDVDDDIWQDVGLQDEYLNPPLWLADDAVHQGICLMLEVDRCEEKERRLMREHCVLQEWYMSEWLAMEQALGNAGKWIDDIVHFHVQAYKMYLAQIFLDWEGKIHHIAGAWEMPMSWGPMYIS